MAKYITAYRLAPRDWNHSKMEILMIVRFGNEEELSYLLPVRLGATTLDKVRCVKILYQSPNYEKWKHKKGLYGWFLEQEVKLLIEKNESASHLLEKNF